jgi:hypothetical protein
MASHVLRLTLHDHQERGATGFDGDIDAIVACRDLGNS